MDKQNISEIFVVDDDLSIGDSISSLLKLRGYRVKTFVSGKEAIKTAKEGRPDLVIIDYLLPGESAIEIIDSLHSVSGESLPIVLMSASSNVAQLAKKLPIVEFIAKPFQIELLLDTIERNLN